METENIHRDWIVIWKRLLKEPRKNIKQMSYILGKSQRFLSILSTGGNSSSYSSYADSLRHTVEEIFARLVENIEEEGGHAGIYHILTNYKQAERFYALPILDRFISGKSSIFLAKSVERLCSNELFHRDIEQYKESILLAGKKGSLDPEHGIGESSIRVIFSLYKINTRREKCLSVLMESIQMRYIDLFISKIFPVIVKNENILFISSLIDLLLKIKEIPILMIAQHLERDKILSLPEGLLHALVERAEKAHLPQEHIGGVRTVVKIPEVVQTNKLLQILLDTPSSDLLYQQAEGLLEHISMLQSLGIEVCVGPCPEKDSENICTSIFGNRLDPQKNKNTPAVERSRINRFLHSLLQGTDSTKIQLCRILYYIKIHEQKPHILLLIKNKNIRVKWNALRALTAYSLDRTEIEEVTNLLMKTENEKIKLWSLKVLAASKYKHNLSGLTVKDTAYREEIEGLIKRINN